MKRIFRKIRRFITKDKVTAWNTVAIVVLVLIVIISGSVYTIIENSKILHSEDEMLQIVKEQEGIVGDLKVIDKMIVDDELLLLCMSGEYFCCAAEFNIVGDGEYKFYRSEEAYNGGAGIFEVFWFDRHIVICNNENVVRYEAEIDGVGQNGNISDFPSVLTFEYESSCNIEFYDKNGDKIN